MWTIPASKVKGKRAHSVPLARQARELVAELRQLTGKGKYVLPSLRSLDRPISNGTWNVAMVEMGIGRDVQTVHGFRATARTILAEVLKYPEHIIDRQLAHVVKDPNGTAYNRTAFLDERRKMMQHWADYLDELRDGPEAKATRQQEEADRLHGEDDRERWARWAHEHPNEYAPGPDDHA